MNYSLITTMSSRLPVMRGERPNSTEGETGDKGANDETASVGGASGVAPPIGRVAKIWLKCSNVRVFYHCRRFFVVDKL